ncbi:MAG TPA: crossover junction endodeoxyribonuclease RuvC [Candidatus Anaerotruncus excrementipullorum]|uniref:Crossover junction endodeoxyribonuclease RuvC n=1 Tax=Candidatus Anaerotruncus excrementipullorum TaxID=2838465 RepID=A0A9D1WRK1_9FIRM|nr:crossover junction endodeoxyribonuclease RuvC [Candidatus Anaerotruncus excrementipullorum]
MVILGIDPGYATVGYGVVRYDRARFSPVRFGAITTPAGMEFSARLRMIYEDVCSVMDRSAPQALSIEQLFFTNNKTTAIDVAQARGVILLAANQRGIPVYTYTPMQVKQSVVGYGKAEKRQVMEMTRQLLGLEKVPRPDDTADALALAICHGHWSGSLLAYKR